jgi:hypothetical protein
MHRPRYAPGFLLAPILFTLVFFSVACTTGGPERMILDRFFQASKLRDNVTLGGIALVAFDKNTQGVVERFSVVSVSEPQVTPLHLKDLAKVQAEAMKASEDLNKRKLAYQDEHADELKRLLDAERKGQKIKGKDAEFQASWIKWREDTAAVEKKVSLAREELSAERSVADISTFNPQTPIDPAQYDGEMASKDYTISASISLPDGQHVTKTLVVTLQQVRLKGDKGDITGKWIITRIKDAPGGTAS